MNRLGFGRAALVLAAALFVPVCGHGADYLWMTADGAPRTWAGAVTYNPDQGSLGLLGNEAARARLRAAFDTWAAVDTSTLRNFREGRQLPRDATVENFRNSYAQCDDAFSAIIFDTDGSILEDLLGVGGGNAALGVGFPNCINDDGDIIQGTIVLNGRFLDGIDEPGNREYSPERFQNVIVHEIGHFLNLAHTQVGIDVAFDNDSANDGLVPIMFPIAVRPEVVELQLDDRAAISHLYPTAAFQSGRGRISGRVFSAEGQFAGANLVARRVDDPQRVVVGAASGGRYDADDLDHPPENLRGFYLIPGLPPGEYTLQLEQLARFYGSIVSFPVPTLPGPREFWNGDNESATAPPDDPDEAVTITVAGGDDLRNVDLMVNEPDPAPANDLCEQATEIAAVPFEATIDTRFATVDRARCANQTNVVANMVWYRHTAAAAGVLEIHASSPVYRPVIAALARCGDDARACSRIDAPVVRVAVEAGETLVLAIADGDFSGGGELTLGVDAVPEGPQPCVADCDADGIVVINELTAAVRIALGSATTATCPRADRSGDGRVEITELVAAIAAALNGCSD
jgi:hypothetical protein